MTSKKEYEALIEEVREHDRLYFEEAKPLISDYTYDTLLKKIEKIEKEHPEWVRPDSPTLRVGKALTTGFKRVKHRLPMLSLSNTYSQEEVEDFVKRVEKLLGHKKVTFSAELKMDGVAISVIYRGGKYAQAVTRGDGKQGDDVTANLKTVHTLPLHLEHLTEDLEVRGEVFMPLKVFRAQNQQLEERGLQVWANPRNAAAGSLKLLDPQEVIKRRLSVVFYGIAAENNAKVATQIALHQQLEKWGLPCFLHKHRKLCHNVDEIFAFANAIEAERDTLPFEIDGIVVKVNELKYHDILGSTGKSPRFAVAYKFAPEQAVTQIKEISLQVGRTGVITPVAELEPVFVAGSLISRATLHNQEEIERKDIREGDWVVIEKGGDVIPKVVEVKLAKRKPGLKEWKMPKHCPSCHSLLVHLPEEVAVRCLSADCLEKRVRRIAYFVSKDAMDIAHLGEKVVEQLVEKGLVTQPSDIYRLTERELESLEGFKEKSIQNLLHSIEASKKVSLARFILALGIKYVGEATAELLAERARDIDKLMQLSREELMEIEGIGEKAAGAIIDYFQEETHRKEVELLLQDLTVQKPAHRVNQDHPFNGKVFVITGTLHDFTRSGAASLIKERGGKVTGSVSKKTDYLLVGEDPGSKLEKAQELEVKQLSESAFKRLLGPIEK